MTKITKLLSEILETNSLKRIGEIKEEITEIVLSRIPDQNDLKFLSDWQFAVDYRIEMLRNNLEIPGNIFDMNQILKFNNHTINENLEFQQGLAWLKSNGQFKNSIIENLVNHEVQIKVTFNPCENPEEKEEVIGADFVKLVLDLYRSNI
ncbi:hypothetical protein OA88_00295 [Flavobacterium sp. JRM]|nr:hypothetical protein OA88_00295 [Flavobacterium sp. JRM]